MFTKNYKVTISVETNLIAIHDDRSQVGKLHLAMNSQHLEVGGVGIPVSINPGPPVFAGLAVADRDTYLLNHMLERAQWENDKNADEAAKKFVLSRYELVYFQSLSHPLTKFKGVTLRTILDFLKAQYPAEPEEIALQKEALRAKWDPNNHIENLFQSVKEGCETLVAMKSIVLLEMDKTFCEYTYNAIKNSGQFESACIKWKALDTANQLLPVPVPATALAMKEFFKKKYDVFDANNDSLRIAGIANNVQLQALVQATNDQMAQLRSEQQATRAAQSTVLQILKEKTSSDADDTATTLSAMTAHTAVQDRQQQRIDDLEALLRSSRMGGGTCNNNSSNGNSSNSNNSSRGGGSSNNSRGGGRGNRNNNTSRGGRGSGTKTYSPRSDGPANMTKTGQYYGNDNYCWSHGYDVAKNHDSKSCKAEWRHENHKEEATGDNPMRGSDKDKQFSKWRD